MKDFFRILKLVKGYGKYATLNVVFNLFAIIFSAFSLVMLMPIMEILFNQEGRMQELLANPPVIEFGAEGYSLKEHAYFYLAQQVEVYGQETVLLAVCLFIIGTIFLKSLCTYFALYFMAVIRNGVIRDFRNNIFSKITRLPLSYFSDERKGDIISRVTNDLKEIEWSVLRSIEAVFKGPLTIVMYFTMLILMSTELTLFLIIFFPIAGSAIGIIGNSLKRSAAKGQKQLGGVISQLEETLSGLRIIKAFNAEKKTSKKFNRLNEDYTDTMTRMYRKADLASPTSEFLGVTLIASVLWYGGHLVFNSETTGFTGSFFIVYIATLSQLIPPFKSITAAYSNAQRGLASLERIKEITEAEETIKEVENHQSIQEFSTQIEFNNVSFKYENDNVLDNISFSLSKGKSIALVGQSGSGKSTIANLLPRFYDIQSGEILIDGIDIKQMSLSNLRDQLGMVTQQSILFNDSIFNNIAFGKETATKEEVIQAAKIANAHDFIMQTENGYDTNIGDDGGKLSGGQRQRLSIARAVLKNPEILILDEATSALDTESEKLVQDALNNLLKDRTSIVIAHRLSTIQHCDEILVMQEGKIVERGTHESLIQLNGTYKRLTDLQSF